VTGEHQKGRTMTCPCQKLFRRSHQEGTDDGARLACPLVSQESVVAWREPFTCPMAYAARRTGAVSTALGTSTGSVAKIASDLIHPTFRTSSFLFMNIHRYNRV